MKKKLITACLAVFSLLKADAQTVQQIVDLRTGIVNGSGTPGTLIAPNVSDDTWQLSIFGGAYAPVQCSNGLLMSGSTVLTGPTVWTTTSNARWLSPYTDATGGVTSTAAAGFFDYQMTFTTTSDCQATAAQCALSQIGADNTIVSLKVNGNAHTIPSSFTTFSSLTFPITASEIVPGTNTIIVRVRNDLNPLSGNNTFTGFLLNGTLTITYPALAPAFSAPTTVCSGDPIILNGSASTGSIGYHAWGIVECNASGVPTSPTTWWTGSIPGAPGTYTVPAAGAGGPTMACGKYYLVTLHVDNICTEAETTNIIRLNCTPVANAGPDQTICTGSCVTIGAGRTDLGSTYTWTNSSGYVGTGKSITVCPTATTTYTVTVTSNTTGCSATDAVTITVLQPTHATFNYSDDATPLTYYTVTVTPLSMYLSEVSQPGWGDTWVIEERDPANPSTVLSSTASGSLPNPPCWWSYGAPHSFAGFTGTINVNCGAGPAYNTPSPAIGQFLYGHYYMIIRTTWNSVCGWSQSSFPSYRATRSADAPAVNGVSKETALSGLVDIAAGINTSAMENGLNIYPNPGNGIFTVALNNSVKTNMEIYDMKGKKVKEEQVTGNYTLDLSGYSKGIYMIRMIINDQPVMKKIILE